MRILIVEDEKQIAEGIKRIIVEEKRFKVDVKIAYDGKEGLRIGKSYKPHLVITDIRMHHMNGLDMIKALIDESEVTKFIVLSGYDKFEFAQKAIRYNVIDYLLKPVNKQRLLELIQQVYMALPRVYEKDMDEVLQSMNLFTPDTKNASYPDSLRSVLSYIMGNYMLELSLQTISEEIMLHSSYISKLINQHTGHSFNYILNHVRIGKACELLIKEKEMTISEISYLVGYSSSRRMHEAFRHYIGMTPTEFRNKEVE